MYAFGGVGIFVFATAITGLVGAARSIRWCLNLYSTLVIVLLVAEGAMIVAYFADDSWQKRLPHDDTGEAKQVGRRRARVASPWGTRGLHGLSPRASSLDRSGGATGFTGSLRGCNQMPGGGSSLGPTVGLLTVTQ